MKRIAILLLVVCSLTNLYSQERNQLNSHHLSVDFGSYRNRYLYPITDVNYGSPLFTKLNLNFSVRMRSYGSWYLFNKNSYDFTPQVSYYFSRTSKPVYFSVGLGLDARLRFDKDERSFAESSAEPLFSFAAHGTFKKFSYSLPIWSRYYSNGISFSMLPEVYYQMTGHFSLFVRYELSLQRLYGMDEHEWRRDCFIGTRYFFNRNK